MDIDPSAPSAEGEDTHHQITIRQAGPEDVALLADLAYRTFWDAFAHHPKNAPDDLNHYMRQAFNPEQLATELASENNLFLISETNDAASGYAKLVFGNIEAGISASQPVELERLYAHQEHLGTGVGQRLMDACLDRSREHGCDVIWLGVWEFNPRAQRFYEKNGFRVVGTHVFQLGSDPQTDILMQREL